MGNSITTCNTCFDRLGHRPAKGPLITVRRRNVHTVLDDSNYSHEISEPDFSFTSIAASDTATSSRVSRRRPSVSPAAIRRRAEEEKSADWDEEEEEEEEDDVEKHHEQTSTNSILVSKINDVRKYLVQPVKINTPGSLLQTSAIIQLDKSGHLIEWIPDSKKPGKILGTFPINMVQSISVSPKNSRQLDIVVRNASALTNYTIQFESGQICMDWKNRFNTLQQLLNMA